MHIASGRCLTPITSFAILLQKPLVFLNEEKNVFRAVWPPTGFVGWAVNLIHLPERLLQVRGPVHVLHMFDWTS